MIQTGDLNSLLEVGAEVRDLADELLEMSSRLKAFDPSTMTTQHVEQVFERTAEAVLKVAMSQKAIVDVIGRTWMTLLLLTGQESKPEPGAADPASTVRSRRRTPSKRR